MSKQRHSRQRHSVTYPAHAFRPEDLLRFVELKPFTDAWDEMNLDDEDLAALQVLVMLNPKAHPVVQGTGGLRKIRFAPRRWNTGKSGAARVGYVYMQDYATIVLVIAYAKNERDDLTPAEKKAIHSLIQRIEREFASGVIK